MRSAVGVVGSARVASASYAASVLVDSPRGHWRAGDSSGTVAVDASGNGRNGTYSGSPTLGAAGLVTGDPDTCANLDGVNDHIHFGGWAAWMDTAYISLEAIIKPDTVSGTRQIMDRDGATRIFQFRVDGAKLQFLCWNSGGTLVGATGATTLVANTRYHVGASFDGASVRVFLNGTQDGSAALSGTLRTGSTPLLIGTSVGGAYFDGPFDEPAYYGAALSSARFLDHAQKAGLA